MPKTATKRSLQEKAIEWAVVKIKNEGSEQAKKLAVTDYESDGKSTIYNNRMKAIAQLMSGESKNSGGDQKRKPVQREIDKLLQAGRDYIYGRVAKFATGIAENPKVQRAVLNAGERLYDGVRKKLTSKPQQKPESSEVLNPQPEGVPPPERVPPPSGPPQKPQSGPHRTRRKKPSNRKPYRTPPPVRVRPPNETAKQETVAPVTEVPGSSSRHFFDGVSQKLSSIVKKTMTDPKLTMKGINGVSQFVLGLMQGSPDFTILTALGSETLTQAGRTAALEAVSFVTQSKGEDPIDLIPGIKDASKEAATGNAGAIEHKEGHPPHHITFQDDGGKVITEPSVTNVGPVISENEFNTPGTGGGSGNTGDTSTEGGGGGYGMFGWARHVFASKDEGVEAPTGPSEANNPPHDNGKQDTAKDGEDTEETKADPIGGAGSKNPFYPSGMAGYAARDEMSSNATRRFFNRKSAFNDFDDRVANKGMRGAHGEKIGDWEKTGDVPAEQPGDNAKPSLRPQFGQIGVRDALPSTKAQLMSDIEFDMFSVVPPGYGEGVDNKMYLYQKAHENHIHFAPPFYAPGVWLGPNNTQQTMPWQWQTVKHPTDIAGYKARVSQRAKDGINYIRSLGEASSGAIGRDVSEYPTAVSSSGLRRDIRSPFEPVIHNMHPWTPDFDPPGYALNRRGMKRLFSPWRDPDVREIQPDNGGPTLRKRRALEVIIP